MARGVHPRYVACDVGVNPTWQKLAVLLDVFCSVLSYKFSKLEFKYIAWIIIVLFIYEIVHQPL